MKTDVKTLIFFREDLAELSKTKPIQHIDFSDFGIGLLQTYLTSDVVLFVDKSGQTKLLKNRYGNRGIVSEE